MEAHKLFQTNKSSIYFTQKRARTKNICKADIHRGQRLKAAIYNTQKLKLKT